MATRVSFLGGLGEIGRNCAAIEVDGRICLVDVGFMFPEADMPGVDLVFPDWSWLVERRSDVAFVVLTHGHEDHIGALSYFLQDVPVPVYGQPLTLGFARPRAEELGVEADFREVEPLTWVRHEPFQFQLIPVTHSVPQAASILFDTPDGLLLHSGDFKLDPTPIGGQPTHLSAIGYYADEGIRLLLSDSTNAEEPGHSSSEASISGTINSIVAAAPGRVVAACFSTHIHRVQQMVNAAAAADRYVAFVGRSMERNTRIAAELGVLDTGRDRVLPIEELLALPPEKTMVVNTGAQGEPYAALSLMSAGRHKWVELAPDDTVIIAATPIHGNETAVARLLNGLARREARVFHGLNSAVHVSGHAKQGELLTMLNLTRPQAFVPVHGEYRHLAAHAALARQVGVPWVEVLTDGDAVVLDGDETRVERNAFEAGYVYVEGSSYGEIDRPVLRDRSHLADDGVIVVTVGVSRDDGKLLLGPELDSHGFMEDPSEVLERAAEAVEDTLTADPVVGDMSELRTVVLRAVSRTVRSSTSRRPVVVPIVMEL